MPIASNRFQPVALPADRRIDRPQLSRLLTGRFEVKVTLVTAGAGHGKSTALAEAVANNGLDPAGVDVWLTAIAADADPIHLLAGLARSLGLPPRPDRDDALAAIVDRVWAEAPEQVALILDDAHHLASEAATATIASLIERLPANGHLVLAGRRALPLPLGRLDSLQEVMRVDADRLLFDDDELATLAQRRGRPEREAAGLPRLAALADLQLRAGPTAGSDYLWEEVLASLGQPRLTDLTRAAVLDEIDDEMIDALSGGRNRAAGLVADLPMVESGRDGRFRLHGLLRAALLERAGADLVADANRQAAAIELSRERLLRAARHLAAAGEIEQATGVIRRFASLPLLRAPLEEIGAMIALARELVPGSLLLRLLEYQLDYGRYDRERIEQFIDLARLARAEGDTELETLAIHRAAQGAEQGFDPLPADLIERIGQLADRHPPAGAVDAHIGSMAAIRRGDSETARRLLGRFDHFDRSARAVLLAERLCELGQPELVDPAISPDRLGQLPPGAETLVGFALWLRGEALPDLALAGARQMVVRATRSAHRYGALATLSVASHVAVAAGDLDLARDWADRSIDLAGGPVAPAIKAYALVADASVTWAAGGDPGSPEGQAIDDAMARLLDAAPIGRWPIMPYLMALPMLYTCHPESRPVLQRCDFGPALTTAVALGRALVALQEGGDGEPASRLPWSDEAVLRAHLPPRQLMVLAAAGAEAGRRDAAELVDRLPGSRSLLERAAGRPHDSGPPVPPGDDQFRPGQRWARARLAGMPPPPPPPVRLRAIGPLAIEADACDRAGPGDGRLRRARVKELLAYLVEHRSAARAEVAAALWPELDRTRAGANLRVNLNHLQRALDPDRTGDRDGHVVTEGARLVLSGQVSVDVDELDRLMADARRLDQEGAPAGALPLYRRAADLVGGHYLEEIEADWAVPTRMRIQATAAEAWCRIGELTLAQGEPEEALGWATRAVRESSIDERAGRLLTSCFAAMGDRPAASRAADRLLAELAAANLQPQQATVRLAERIRQRG